MSHINGIKLVCCDCFSALKNEDNNLVCTVCGKLFPIQEGIFSFTEINLLFEGRFTDYQKLKRNKWYNPILEKFDISRQRINFLKKYLKNLKNKDTPLILDIGCGGGGWGLTLKQYGSVVGIDVSVESLKHASNIYKNVIHASVTKLPFPQNYFDAIVSEDVIGHISLKDKEKAFSEIHRVLKPGGFMIHAAIETDSKSYWFSFAKKYPNLFKKYHIDKHGHIGLELPSSIIERCKNMGFRIREVEKMHAFVIYPELVTAWFDNEYKDKNKLIYALVKASRKINNSKKIQLLANLSLGIVEKMVNPFISEDQATGLLLYCQKKYD